MLRGEIRDAGFKGRDGDEDGDAEDGVVGAQVALHPPGDLLRFRRRYEANLPHKQGPSQGPEEGLREVREGVPAGVHPGLQGAEQVVQTRRRLVGDRLRTGHGPDTQL